MGRKGKQAKHTPLSADLLGFKSAVETRNVYDSNSVAQSQEVSFCANDYTGFRFLNSQIIKEIGVRQPKEKIIQWLKEREFFFIDFNLMCVREDNKSHRFYYPCELGLVKYSMINGIIDEFHTFIDCGDIPVGYFREAFENEANHRIPITDRIELKQLCSYSNEKIVEKLIQLITKSC
ncbi:hypothetical protein B4U80_05317 [Leptotrombidium deliense]|uniref:Maelstrom domain-containing protein n=1 Tax=Leptotrombidium deliense TaxID=299467 RepID=A0A443SIV8_9ACAR|nr:hypothetical protein B4U80_05317 [Leptotrombidium deliense]